MLGFGVVLRSVREERDCGCVEEVNCNVQEDVLNALKGVELLSAFLLKDLGLVGSSRIKRRLKHQFISQPFMT